MHIKDNFSLTTRLLGWVGVTTVVIFLGFGLYIEHTAKEHFLQQDYTELNTTARTIEEFVGKGLQQDSQVNYLDIIMSGHPSLFAYVENMQGVLYVTNNNHDEISSLIAEKKGQTSWHSDQLQTWEKGSYHYRVLINRIHRSPTEVLTVVVGMNINFHQHYLQMFRRNLWIGGFIACLLMIGVSWLFVRKGLAPIRVISKQIQNITTEHLNIRLADDSVPIELKSLVGSFNAMLGDIEEVFQRQSQFSTDIAHELRTPVTSLMMQTQIALSKVRTLEEYQNTLYGNLEELEYLSKIINDMLFLAKVTKNQVSLEKVEVKLNSEITALMDYFELLAEEVGIDFVQHGDAPNILGDQLMIRRALSNLFSNAIKYAKSHTQVIIELTKETEYSVLRMTNVSANVISQNQLEHLFDRFYRVDPARERKNGGTGIGLSIVKSIIDIHGGKFEVKLKQPMISFIIKLVHV